MSFRQEERIRYIGDTTDAMVPHIHSVRISDFLKHAGVY